ncbi:MAG: ferritin family protein [Coprobacillus sp.]
MKQYTLDIPYPSVDSLDINIDYGHIILPNLGGLISEMNAVSLYAYNSIITEQSWPELSSAMHEISLVEMKHLNIFSKMCYRLGVDPRLWDCQNDFLEYWSPGFNVYPRQIHTLLENSIIQENKTILMYQQQISKIDEPIIQDVLKRIILDEQLHLQIFEYFLDTYNQKNKENCQ